MLNNIVAIFKTIAPLLVYVAIGMYLASRYKFNSSHLSAFNTFVFHILMPASLFITSLTSAVNMGELVKPCLAVILAMCLICFVSGPVSKRAIYPKDKAAGFACSMWKGNFTMLGLPIGAALLSAEGYSIFAMMAVIAATCSNIIIVPQLASIMEGDEDGSVIRIIKTILKNPLIIGIIAGFAVKLSGLTIPNIILSPIKVLSSCASPMSMILIGISIAIRHGILDIKLTNIACLLKLIVNPVVYALVAYIIGVRGVALSAACIFGALPTAMNCAIIADSMGADGGLVNEVTFLSTIYSGLTLFVLGVIIRTTGWY